MEWGKFASMQVTETLSENLKRAFTVVLPAAELVDERKRQLAEMAKTIRMPGFRPGHVPTSLVQKRYGEAVEADVVNNAVQGAVERLMTDRGLRAATEPKVDLTKKESGSDLEFRLELEVFPEIALPELKEISLIRLKAEPTEDAVDAALGRLARNQQQLESVDEVRGAEKGEVVRVDYAGTVDGETFAGGSAQDAELEVAGSGYIAGFTEQLEGIKAGEVREVSVTFPENYQASELAGKAAVFKITAKSLHRRVLPDMNDAFAEKLGFDNLGDLRDALRKEMQREYDGLSRNRIKRELLDHLADHTHFETPESLVNQEFSAIWERVEAARKNGQADEEDQGKDDDTLRVEYRGIAERRVRLGLLLSEIGRVNDLQVSADELRRAMRTEAMKYPGHEQKIYDLFNKNPGMLNTLRGPLMEEKVVDFILDHATIAEREATADELSAEPDKKAA
jgi:trigger factor